MTVYCYDTEFLEDGSTIDLISIGIVCEDGREYYAINSDADWERIRKDGWLMDNVVRHLPTHPGGQVEKPTRYGNWQWGGLDMKSAQVKPKWVIANEVRDFLLAADTPELWAYYGAYNHVALAQLWGRTIDLPKGLPMWTHELLQALETAGIGAPPPAMFENNALADARWNWELLQLIRAAA